MNSEGADLFLAEYLLTIDRNLCLRTVVSRAGGLHHNMGIFITPPLFDQFGEIPDVFLPVSVRADADC